MKLKKILIEVKNKIKENGRLINEHIYSGKTIINVDIQPEYQKFFSFDKYEWANFLNENSEKNKIIFLYNGHETLGLISETDYINWLIDLGVEEDVINEATFYDKGYAFFRSCIDRSIDDDEIVELIKFMIDNDVYSNRDMTDELWEELESKSNIDLNDIKTLLLDQDEFFNIPEVMDFLRNQRNIILTGGGIDECLKEVELALLSLNISYSTHSEFLF